MIFHVENQICYDGYVLRCSYPMFTPSRLIDSNKQKFKEHRDPAAVPDVRAAYLDINRVPPHRGTFNFISN